MEWMKDYIKEFISLLNDMSIYLLVGFLIAGILHVLINKELIIKYLGKNSFKSVVYSSLIGIPLPLCSCGVIPTGISLKKEGASDGATVSFLISTPQTGVDSILLTYSMMGLPFAIIRPIIAFISGILGGIFTNILHKSVKIEKKPAPQFQIRFNEVSSCGNTEEHCNCKTTETKTKDKSKLYKIFYYGFIEFIEEIAKWLLIGLFAAALISVLVPDNFFITTFDNYFLQILSVLIVSIAMYVCATGSVPLAAVLLMKGISPGAAIVFLMAGPATNIATITVLFKSLGKKLTYIYIFSIISTALLFGVLVNEFFPIEWFSLTNNHTHEHEEMIPEWIKYSSSIILMILLLFSMSKKYFKRIKIN